MTAGLTLQRSPADAVDVARRHHPDLPPVPHGHWLPNHKEAVVQAISTGRLGAADAVEAWDLSEEELQLWLERYARHGRNGLCSTKAQRWRRACG